MNVDTNTLLYVLFALIGVGYAWFLRWAGRVDNKLESLDSMRLEVVREYTTKTECESGKKHIWEKLSDHERRLSTLEREAEARRVRAPIGKGAM